MIANTDLGEAVQWDGFDDVQDSETPRIGKESMPIWEGVIKKQTQGKNKKEKKKGNGGLDMPNSIDTIKPRDDNAFGILDQPEDNDVDGKF